jgi:hypothetical protein
MEILKLYDEFSSCENQQQHHASTDDCWGLNRMDLSWTASPVMWHNVDGVMISASELPFARHTPVSELSTVAARQPLLANIALHNAVAQLHHPLPQRTNVRAAAAADFHRSTETKNGDASFSSSLVEVEVEADACSNHNTDDEEFRPSPQADNMDFEDGVGSSPLSSSSTDYTGSSVVAGAGAYQSLGSPFKGRKQHKVSSTARRLRQTRPKVIESKGAIQCKGRNRKKGTQCRNAALMEYIGPRPQYCAEHIELDPDTLYVKCKSPYQKEHGDGKACKEVVLKEFGLCYKHLPDMLAEMIAVRDHARLQHAAVRAVQLLAQLEREASIAKRRDADLYQRKNKLIPKFQEMKKAVMRAVHAANDVGFTVDVDWAGIARAVVATFDADQSDADDDVELDSGDEQLHEELPGSENSSEGYLSADDQNSQQPQPQPQQATVASQSSDDIPIVTATAVTAAATTTDDVQRSA